MTKHLFFAFILMFLTTLSAVAADNSTETVVRKGDRVILGNGYLAREFSLKNGHVRTCSIVNKRTGKLPMQIIPEASSEDFIIRTLSPDSVVSQLRSSDLLLGDLQITSEDKDTRKLVFRFQPYRLKGVDWQVNMIYVLQKGKYYMRKYLEIQVPESQREEARLESIDFESIKLPSGCATWTHPEMENGVGGVSGYYISLGQPVYIQAMFFGLEFPATESEITQDNVAHIRYYSGKSFTMLDAEHRLKNGVFTTWKEVIGAARSADIDVIQSDFFGYIDEIATPIKLRTQYNSWYDFMLDIDESNILGSFKEMERGLTQHGVRPLDSYVVDDGWNAYGPWQKENTAKFWSFNSKFPDGLSTPVKLVHQLASNFGLWLGPRGGYNYFDEFARFLEKNGNGKLNIHSQDICTNHKVYLEKLKDFFLDCEKKYDLNYWKLDGFMVTPPQPDPKGNYISGGYKGMYYVTEHWERWIDIFKAMRDARGADRDNLWINLTCYMNPSPWFLQWANSVWIQNSGDMGRLDVGRKAAVDELLSYRDGRYFDFVKTRAFQFPLSHIYNHDPIYGNAGNLQGTMNDDDFRTYLMMMATRGTAFWELYYSYNMMNEGHKWLINAETLQWIRDNYQILRHAKLIGQTPVKGTPYGYSAWAGNEGVISVRNPSDKSQSFTFVLDRNIGVPEGLKGLYRTTVWQYNSNRGDDNTLRFGYGEPIRLNLQPGEVRIWKFSTSPRKKGPELLGVKTLSPTTLVAEFSEPVHCSDFVSQFAISGLSVEHAQVMGDRRLVVLSLAGPMHPNSSYRLKVSNLAGYSEKENKLTVSVPFTYFKDGEIPMSTGIGGTTDFNISFALNTSATSVSLLNQKKDIRVFLNDAGKIVFDVKGLAVVSDAPVNTGKTVFLSLCRERNGMLKIYINGELDASVYHGEQVNQNIKLSPCVVNKHLKGEITQLLLTNFAFDYKRNEMRSLQNTKGG